MRPWFFYHGVMKPGLLAILVVPTLCSLLLSQCVSPTEEGEAPGDVVSVAQPVAAPTAQPMELPVQQVSRRDLEKPLEKPSRSMLRRVSRQDAEPPADEIYTASIRLGSVIILEGTRRVATCQTAGLKVQEARFINGQKQIVVKSGGRHGPLVVQLFDTRTGAEKDAVLAHEIREGQPAWAAGLEN